MLREKADIKKLLLFIYSCMSGSKLMERVGKYTN